VEYAPLAGHFLPLGVLLRTQRYPAPHAALQLNQTHPFRTRFNETALTSKLLKEQLADGSWKQLGD
jgi:hypothetical protein